MLPSMDLLRLPEPKASKKTVLKVKRFKDSSFRGSKGAFVNYFSTRERFQVGMPLLPLGLSLWKLSSETSEILILVDINGDIAQFVSNG